MARFEETIREMKLALELDPLFLVINRNLGQIFYRVRQYNRAIEAFYKTLEMDPNFSFTHFYLGKTYVQKSMYKKALAEFHKEKEIIRVTQLYVDAWIVAITALMGKKNEALQMLNDLMEQSKLVYIRPYLLACIYAALGEDDLCFKWLNKAYEEHDSYLRWLKGEALFDCIRSDPRFKALLKKVGLDK